MTLHHSYEIGKLATPYEIRQTGHTPGGHVFWCIKFVFAILVEGNSVIISTKLFWILTTGFTEEDFKVFHMAISHAPWQPCFLMDQIPFSYFCKGSPNIHFSRIKISILNTGFMSKMLVSYIGTLGKLATLPGGHFINGLICFGYFCGRLSNDHFYLIFLNSNHRFQRRSSKFLLSR